MCIRDREQAKTDEAGKPVLDAQGKPVKDDVRLERPRVFFATVFNAEQIDGLPPIQPRKEQEWNALERVEHIPVSYTHLIRTACSTDILLCEAAGYRRHKG